MVDETYDLTSAPRPVAATSEDARPAAGVGGGGTLSSPTEAGSGDAASERRLDTGDADESGIPLGAPLGGAQAGLASVLAPEDSAPPVPASEDEAPTPDATSGGEPNEAADAVPAAMGARARRTRRALLVAALALVAVALVAAVALSLAGAGSIEGDWYSEEGGITFRLSVDGGSWAYYALGEGGEAGAALGRGEVRRAEGGAWVFSGGMSDSCERRGDRLVFRDGSTMGRERP